MKRVLITGATGFIGAAALPALAARGFEIHAVTHRPVVNVYPGITWHQADLFNGTEVAALCEEVRPSHLLHFAWYVEHGIFWTSPENERWVQASLDLFEAFAAAGGARAVMVGSCAEYDWAYSELVEASTPLAPASLYGECKLRLQQELASRGAERGVSTAWGRIFFLYGPRENPRRLVASVIEKLLRNEPALCTHGRQIRDFLHVDDVAGAFVALLDSSVTGPVNIASGQGVAVGDVVKRVGELVGRPELIQLGALPAPENEPPALVGSALRLQRVVGWTPVFSLETGLRQAIDWWRNRL